MAAVKRITYGEKKKTQCALECCIFPSTAAVHRTGSGERKDRRSYNIEMFGFVRLLGTEQCIDLNVLSVYGILATAFVPAKIQI